VRETAADLDALQELLDASHAAAGPHLRRIITDERRLTAREVAERLTGMRLLALATVTGDGRPIVGPVDGIFFRGCFHFGSSPDSVRFRHIRSRPQVSATHLPGEELAVTVHGRAVEVDIGASEHAEFRATLLDVYLPRYGEAWETFLDSGVLYARIEPAKMFTFRANPADLQLPTDADRADGGEAGGDG
jgi:nitroimidazol reductase NimA-like FMN-containing flavoprotein (pyridoxamine 5'-phosphate oxidase superfamily)